MCPATPCSVNLRSRHFAPFAEQSCSTSGADGQNRTNTEKQVVAGAVGLRRPLGEDLRLHGGAQHKVAIPTVVDPWGDGMTATLDSPRQVRQLETRWRVLQALQELFAPDDADPGYLRLEAMMGGHHTVERIGNQFGAKLVGAFLKKDPDGAWVAYSTLRPTTVGEQMAGLLNKDEFSEMHRHLHRRLRLENADIDEVVSHRLATAFPRADHHEFACDGTGSLDDLRHTGLTVQLEANSVHRLASANRRAAGTPVPLSEILEGDRIVRVSGKCGSKVSLIVHDLIDHLWTWDLLDRVGLTVDYAQLLSSIGDPHRRDLRSREGEVVASVAFGIRLYNTSEPGFVPIVSASRIRKLLERHRDEPGFEERHSRALDAVTAATIDHRLGCERISLEAQSLAFVFSNYLTELNEQRRKHGCIKQRSGDRALHELSPFDLDFLSFFVEAHHQLATPKNKHLDALAKAQLMIEEFLLDIAEERLAPPYETTFTLDALDRYRAEATRVPFARVRWMFAHYGFAASQAPW